MAVDPGDAYDAYDRDDGTDAADRDDVTDAADRDDVTDATDLPEAPPGPPGKVRAFSDGFLLTVFTFGVYPFVWHHRVHDELMRHLGRPNRLQRVWWAHILLLVGMLVFVAAAVVPAALENGDEYGLGPSMSVEPVMRQAETTEAGPHEAPVDREDPGRSGVAAMLKDEGLYGPMLFFLVGIHVTFAIYVIGQNMWLYTARGEGARAGLGAAVFFLLLIYLWNGLDMLSPPFWVALLLLVLPIIAYYNLQASYNDLWTDHTGQGIAGDNDAALLPGVVQTSTGCGQCGGRVHAVGNAGAELTLPCPSCGWHTTLRLSQGPAEAGPASAARDL